MTHDHPGPSGFAGDPFDQHRLPLDVEPDALGEGLEPPMTGQGKDLAWCELMNLPGEEPPSFAPLDVKQVPPGLPPLACPISLVFLGGKVRREADDALPGQGAFVAAQELGSHHEPPATDLGPNLLRVMGEVDQSRTPQRGALDD